MLTDFQTLSLLEEDEIFNETRASSLLGVINSAILFLSVCHIRAL